ncbi:MAG TPA: NAD(P)/FAD-dependent oxidoreductase, partial [Pyrinomonadaceae bacterium]
FWSKVEDVMEGLAHYTGPDQNFAEFLDNYKRKTQIEDVRSIATLYVEGFHAAHADRISVRGLNKTNEAAEEIEDDKQFRIQNGYGLLAQTLHDDAVAAGASFHLNTVVEEVHWKRNQIAVLTNTENKFKARRLLITLPLPLLQKTDRVRFKPALSETEIAANKLAMGNAVKVILRFREPYWVASDELKDLTFIHAPAETLPTWWTQFPGNAPLLNGWAGGPRAEKLSTESDDSLLDHALRSLAHIFRVSKTSLEQLLEEFYTHNWEHDPFSRGAYSYIPVGGTDAQAQLAQPLEDTLFFAGEATNTEGHHGTVHGALASGLRAARQMVTGLQD